MMKKLRGFTLIELLITIVILAILAGITIIALNPGQNIDDANDVRRRADVNTILNAVWQNAIANGGTFPAGIPAVADVIANTDVNICADLVPDFLARLPVDPAGGTFAYTDCTNYNTGYSISVDASGQRITVSATLSDGSTYTQTR